MKNLAYFKEFLLAISLNKTRVDKIDKALQVMNDFIESDDSLKDLVMDVFVQGSYRTKTGVRPFSGKEFDVDVVVLHQQTGEEPVEFVDRLYYAFKQNGTYADKVTRKERCIRIEYAGDFHVDLVPAIPGGVSDNPDILKIPNKNSNEWEDTNPVGYAEWFIGRNEMSYERLQSVVKALKRWRDEKNMVRYPSILLTTLLGLVVEDLNVGKYGDEVTALVSIVEDLATWLQGQQSLPRVDNPSLEGEDLAARHWDKASYSNFRSKIQWFAEKAREAYEDEDEQSSIEKWQSLLGLAYPTQLSEDAAIGHAQAQQQLSFDSKGKPVVKPNPGEGHRRTRHFGGVR